MHISKNEKQSRLMMHIVLVEMDVSLCIVQSWVRPYWVPTFRTILLNLICYLAAKSAELCFISSQNIFRNRFYDPWYNYTTVYYWGVFEFHKNLQSLKFTT